MPETNFDDLGLNPARRAMKAILDARPGATVDPVTASRGKTPLALMYKVMGKTFAILGARDEAFVILKCDPHLAEILRGQYQGVGHRSHLDRRYWIAVTLDADVPPEEAKRLALGSYDLVAAGLTKKQKAELAELRA